MNEFVPKKTTIERAFQHIIYDCNKSVTKKSHLNANIHKYENSTHIECYFFQVSLYPIVIKPIGFRRVYLTNKILPKQYHIYHTLLSYSYYRICISNCQYPIVANKFFFIRFISFLSTLKMKPRNLTTSMHRISSNLTIESASNKG